MGRAGITLAVLLGALALLFGAGGNSEELAVLGPSALKWMVGRWNWPGADMSHGWLIPLVSLAMLWTQRERLRAALLEPGGTGWGWVCFGMGLLLYMLGLRVQQTRLVLVSWVILMLAVPWALLGRRVGRIILAPVLYLLFCIPWTFLDALTLPLRLVATAISSGFLNGVGIPVTRVGTAIYIHAGSGVALDVAHPCSGLRYLLAMVALTTAYAYFSQKDCRNRTLLAVFSLPLAVLGNIARIILIAIVGVIFGQEHAAGFYHDYSGFVVFAVAISLMVSFGNWLDRHPSGRQEGVHDA